MEQNREIVNARQAAEWGMRSIQGSFGRLRIPLSITMDHLRCRILLTCFRLHQLRVRLVGINQIQTVYHPLWQQSPEQFLTNLSDDFFEVQRNDRVSRFHLVANMESGILERNGNVN